MIRHSAFLAATVLALLGAARTADAQELSPTLQRIAAAWHRGDVNGIAGMGARGGISLDINGSTVGPLGPRQSAAVLRDVFENRESLSTKVNMAREVEPNRAFGEITWTTRARGTTIPERATIFVALARDENGWRVTEIRLLR